MLLLRLLLLSISLSTLSLAQTQPTKIILDADTGNEMDDLYAIVKAIRDPALEVTALISGHFNNAQLLTDSMWHIYPTRGINTVQISQRENERLLAGMGRTDIPHPMGADRMIGYAWGQYEGVAPPAAPGVDYIVEQARRTSPEDKLVVVGLGAATNVAAAILTDSTIAPNIRLYTLNMKMDMDQRVWNKNSFNARNDTNGLDVLLNCRELEMYIMPGNVARPLVFDRKTSEQKLIPSGGADSTSAVNNILAQRWEETGRGAHSEHIMWDVALIEAIIHPELATLEELPTPPENVDRTLKVYTDIEAERMRADFWESF